MATAFPSLQGVRDWIAPRRNTLLGMSAGFLSGDLGKAPLYAMQGREADDAYATAQKQEAERQQALQDTQALRSKYADFFRQQNEPELADLVGNEQGPAPGDLYWKWREMMGQGGPADKPEAPGGAAFDVEAKLRGEYQGQQGYKDYVQQEQAYQRVLDSAKDASPAGDLALIFNYMKVLDPGSVVRESEFATAAASGSFGDRIKAATDQILSGKRLSVDQRRDFVTRASDLFRGASGLYGGMNDRYSTLAGEYGIDPSHIVRPGAQIGVMDPRWSLDTFLGGGGPVAGTTSSGLTWSLD